MKRFSSWLWVILILLSPAAANAQALLAGSEYYDSFDTLASVVILKAAHNQAGRDWLEKEGRILPKAESSLPIIIIARGQEPESGCEFRFPAFPHTYWTFSENVATIEELKGTAEASPTPDSSPVPAANQVEPEKVLSAPTPSSTPANPVSSPSPSPPTPVSSPAPTPTPKSKSHSKKKESNSAIEWHKVNGEWKWRPLDRSQFKGWEAGAKAPSGNMSP